ncbi:hypothetical protein CDAR_224911 [Caerostris darwini]|uniref:RNase H type-1 domain-containing protein n=1 Tax=Caerostris darwini TaxID=1538125 RepID=A0AAV4NCJ4_9ARAC|nr:hypothetical protein CDAR_224911 [Caerostris darwini]
MAICVALLQLAPRFLYSKVVLLSDSSAAISYRHSKLFLECRALLERLMVEGRHIVLQWIPGQCGILGVEAASMREGKKKKIRPKAQCALPLWVWGNDGFGLCLELLLEVLQSREKG